jgi:hypothetical protein
MHADLRAELDAAHFLGSDENMLLVRILRRVKHHLHGNASIEQNY